MALGNPELVITTEDVFISSPWVKQILNKKNVGFSVANNQAIEKSKGAYVLLLNPRKTKRYCG